VLQAQARLAEAEPLYREALELRRKSRPVGHPDRIQSLNNLALLLREQGKLSETEPLFRELLAEVERTYAKGSGQAANTRLALGSTLTGLNRYAEAEVALLEAEPVLATARGVPPGRHEKCLEALAQLYIAWEESEPGQGHAAKAEQWKNRLSPNKQ
jgi:tetratricopeptide (TPR) repeat protein